MSNKSIKLEKNEVLFREGDASEAMFLIKSGRIAIVKSNAAKDKEMILSEKVQGELLGEMAFFDKEARSAGAKAIVPSEVVELPFKALQEQFDLSPSWLKVMVKTIIGQLRKANIRIRNLENITDDSYDKISFHTTLNVCAAIHLLTAKAPKNASSQPVFTYKELYFYARQAFNQESQKIKRIAMILHELNYLVLSDEGINEDRTVTILDAQGINEFVQWFAAHIGTSDADRVNLEPKEVDTMQVVAFYSKSLVPEKDGYANLNLDSIQKTSQADMGVAFGVRDIDSLANKGLMRDRAVQDNINQTWVQPAEMVKLAKVWKIIAATGKSFI